MAANLSKRLDDLERALNPEPNRLQAYEPGYHERGLEALGLALAELCDLPEIPDRATVTKALETLG